MNQLNVSNIIQQALFHNEIQGQLSDGYWESSGPREHWRPWCQAKAVVAHPVGRNFHADKDNYNLVNKNLIEAVGDRMICYARLAHCFPDLVAKFLEMGIELPEGEEDWEATYEYAIRERQRWIDNGLTRAMFDSAMEASYIDLRRVKIELRDLSACMKARS